MALSNDHFYLKIGSWETIGAEDYLILRPLRQILRENGLMSLNCLLQETVPENIKLFSKF